jgi:cold shock CspA family protein
LSDIKKRRLTGVISVWDLEKGYGFINPATDGGKYFVHASRLPYPWQPKDAQKQLVGQIVSFVVERDHQTGRTFADNLFVCHKEDTDLLGEIQETAWT